MHYHVQVVQEYMPLDLPHRCLNGEEIFPERMACNFAVNGALTYRKMVHQNRPGRFEALKSDQVHDIIGQVTCVGLTIIDKN